MAIEANPLAEVRADEKVVDPVSGVTFVELSHEFGHYQPTQPGYKDVQIRRVATHATHGVLTSHLVTVMHNGTHMNAPIHFAQRGLGVGELPLDLFLRDGVVSSRSRRASGSTSSRRTWRPRASRSNPVTSSSSTPAGTTATPTASSTSRTVPD